MSADVGDVRSLFVYGTLMPGRLRWPNLEPFAVSHRRAAVAGELYDSGRGWPVATLADGTAATDVPGYLVEIDRARLAICLERIDAVENTETDELRRIVVTTRDGATAWAYHFTNSSDGIAVIADWQAVEPAAER